MFLPLSCVHECDTARTNQIHAACIPEGKPEPSKYGEASGNAVNLVPSSEMLSLPTENLVFVIFMISLLFCRHCGVYLLTAGSFVLDVDWFLQGAAHGSHLAGTAIATAVGSAHRIGCLRASLGALTHWLIVLDHANCPVIAHLIQARAGYAEIWPERWRAELGADRWFQVTIKHRGWRMFLVLNRGQVTVRWVRASLGIHKFGVRRVGGGERDRWWNMQYSPIPVTLQLPRLPCVASLCLCLSWCFLSLWRDRQIRWGEDSRKKNHGPIAQRTWNGPANNGRSALFGFFFLCTTKCLD